MEAPRRQSALSFMLLTEDEEPRLPFPTFCDAFSFWLDLGIFWFGYKSQVAVTFQILSFNIFPIFRIKHLWFCEEVQVWGNPNWWPLEWSLYVTHFPRFRFDRICVRFPPSASASSSASASARMQIFDEVEHTWMHFKIMLKRSHILVVTGQGSYCNIKRTKRVCNETGLEVIVRLRFLASLPLANRAEERSQIQVMSYGKKVSALKDRVRAHSCQWKRRRSRFLILCPHRPPGPVDGKRSHGKHSPGREVDGRRRRSHHWNCHQRPTYFLSLRLLFSRVAFVAAQRWPCPMRKNFNFEATAKPLALMKMVQYGQLNMSVNKKFPLWCI